MVLIFQVPGLLGKNVLKIAKAGEGITGERIHRTARVKMSEYYHDLLWTSVGSLAEKILLWSDIQDIVFVPFGLQDVRICLGLSNLLQDNLYAKFGGKLRLVIVVYNINHRTFSMTRLGRKFDCVNFEDFEFQ